MCIVTQHTMHMRHILLPPVACQAMPVFSRYLINGTIFGKKMFNRKYVF